jgi:hypothetical protein
VVAALLPSIVALAILYRQAPSVPYQDDYGAILGFAYDYEGLNSWKEKLLNIATEQSNEYKLVFEHFVVATELELTHHLNFWFLTVLGNLFLLPIGYLLWLTYGDDLAQANRRLLEFLPVSFLFFALTYWENLDWAMTGLQNTPVILFALLAFLLLSKERYPFLTGLAAMLAAFSSANGFLLAPVGLMMLLPRRAYRAAIAWCAAFVPPLAAYLYHFTSTAVVMHPFYYLTRPLFFLAFLGCAIPFRWPAALLGAVLLGIFFLAVRSRFDRSNPVGFYFAVWVLATSLLVSWVRGAIGFYTTSRYSLYSILMLIFCYSFLASYLPERFPGFRRTRFCIASAIVAIGAFTIANVVAYQKLETRRRMILSGIELYRANPEVNSPMVDPLVEKTVPREKALEQAILTRSIQSRIYTLPPKQEIR